MSTAPHYKKPDPFTAHVFNPAVSLLTRSGVSVLGSRILEVPGRKSGLPRRNPANLILGRRHQKYLLTELPPAERPAILRPYLKRWKWEVGQFFDGVGPDASDEQLAGIADRHPVFRLTAVS